MASTKGDGTIEQPLNREPSTTDVVSSFLTEKDGYDRNHGPTPHISAADHFVIIDGLVAKPLKLSVTELAGDFPQHKVACALECAGNRRHSMRTRLDEVQGIDWFDAAILNAEWEGPRLRDILLKAGLKSQLKDLHVAFACYQTKCQDDDWFGGSIPLSRAMSDESEVVLALKTNGEVLTPKHGYPVRVIVPGVLGARSVKWLDQVTISENESPNYYQQHDYKILPPEAKDKDSAAKYWDKVPPMMDNCINAVVAIPEDNETVKRNQAGTINVRGYAVPQGDQGPVICVQVSTDEGKTWQDAKINDGGKHGSKWTWVLWETEVAIEKGNNRSIWAKATDRGGNTQTEARSQWNLRGVGYNGYEARTGLTVI